MTRHDYQKHSKVFRIRARLCLFATTVCFTVPPVSSFHARLVSHQRPVRRRNCLYLPPRAYRSSHLNSWLGDLWDEIIEFSTLGPSERRLLAERRKAASREKEKEEDLSIGSFREARKKFEVDSSEQVDNSVVDLSPAAFRAAQPAAAVAESDGNLDDSDDFDGYALRDILIERFGVPLDVDFQRDASLSCVYCTILPVAFGQRKCRHYSEIDYLMHLQGIVEVLRQYDNLRSFVDFVLTTNKVPKAGTDSVPYRLELSDEQLRKIL